MLNNKKTTFKSSADYLNQTRDELIKSKDEINAEIKKIQDEAIEVNKVGQNLKA